jgi:hypothetical protein
LRTARASQHRGSSVTFGKEEAMSVPLLPWTCGALASVALFSIVGIFIAVFRRRRFLLWLSTLVLVVCCFGAYGAFSRLERIHSELLAGDSTVKTKADLMAHYGSPTWKKLMTHDGRTIEAWIYEVRIFQPHVLRQFEMVDDKILASVETTHI